MNTISIIILTLPVIFLILTLVFYFKAVGVKQVIKLMKIKYPNSRFLNKLIIDSEKLYTSNLTKTLYCGYITFALIMSLILALCL